MESRYNKSNSRNSGHHQSRRSSTSSSSSSSSNVWLFKFLLLVVLTSALCTLVESTPVKLEDLVTRFETVPHPDCAPSTPIRELCERCAKEKKNRVAFTYCCKNEKGVRKHCEDYLTYNLKGKGNM